MENGKGKPMNDNRRMFEFGLLVGAIGFAICALAKLSQWAEHGVPVIIGAPFPANAGDKMKAKLWK